MTAGLVKATLFCLSAALVIGYVLLHPVGAAIDERYARLATARAQLANGAILARTRVDLLHRRSNLARELASLHLTESRPQLVAGFLRLATALAASRRVTIVKVAAGTSVCRPVAASALDEIPLDLAVRGGYAAIFYLVRDWTAANGAAGVGIASLASEPRPVDAQVPLDASLHVTLLREDHERPTCHAGPA